MAPQQMSARLYPAFYLVALGIGAGWAAAASAQHAQSTPPIPQYDNEIVVRANAEGSSIDRDTYVIKDTPLAQTKNATDILQTIPSVTIDASGQVRLVGSASVVLLIDGKPVADSNATLAKLQASQIAKIEVMTNPSAKFSAYGSAGIINIVLRRAFRDGLGGSITGGVGTQRYLTGKLAPTWAGGRWSISLTPSVTHIDTESATTLARVGTNGATAIDRNERSLGTGRSSSTGLAATIGYRPSEHLSYDLTLNLGRSNATSVNRTNVETATGDPFLETLSSRGSLDSQEISFERSATGARPGESLTTSLSWSSNRFSTTARYTDFVGAENLASEFGQMSTQTSLDGKIDYVRPTGSGDTLSLGLEVQREHDRLTYSAEGEPLTGVVAENSRFGGDWFDVSAYATFQSQIGSLKVLPGLRVQSRRFDFDRQSGVCAVSSTLLFPSLHLERKFGKLTATASVSRRADWPSISEFYPNVHFTGPTTADSGNSSLRPVRTLAVEAGAELQVGKQTFSLKLYDRHQSGIVESTFSIGSNDEVLATPQNAGDRDNKGGEVVARGKLSSALRYSISGWFSLVTLNHLTGNAIIRDSTREYGGNGQLEYSHGQLGKPGFEQGTLNFRYQGPLKGFQTDTSSIFSIDFSYTRYLTNKLSIVGTVGRLFSTRHVTTENYSDKFYQKIVNRITGPTAKLALVYSLRG